MIYYFNLTIRIFLDYPKYPLSQYECIMTSHSNIFAQKNPLSCSNQKKDFSFNAEDMELKISPQIVSIKNQIDSSNFKNQQIQGKYSNSKIGPSNNFFNSSCFISQSQECILDPSTISPKNQNTILTINPEQPDNSINKYFAKSSWSLEDFEIGKILGQGSYGVVYLAREKRTKYIVALKFSVFYSQKNECLDVLRKRELTLHSSVSHPHILGLFGSFRWNRFICFILEYASDGDMAQMLQFSKQKRLSENQTRLYMRQIMLAVDYLHSRNILHRDIKVGLG